MSLSLKYVGLNTLKSTSSVEAIFNPSKPIGLLATAADSGHRRIHILLKAVSGLEFHENEINVPAVIPQPQQSWDKPKNLNKRFFSSDKGKLDFFHRYKHIMDAPSGVFKGLVDRFEGVTIDSETEYNESDNFKEKLKKSLDYWIKNKRRAIWFRVKTEHSEWITELTKNGFDFHHAKKGIVILLRWLPTDEYINLPYYAHTMLGVGGLVINGKNEVLVVNERRGLIPKSWKLPGGYAEPNEDIVDVAIREVREETGVETEFNTMVCFRHIHNGTYGCSDLYCVVALTPKTQNLVRDSREILKLQWMPVQEYLNHPNVHETNRHFVRCYLDYQKRGIRFTYEKGVHQILNKEYSLYYMKPIEDKHQT